VTGTIVRSGKRGRDRGRDRTADAGDELALLDAIAPWSDGDAVEPAHHRDGRRGDGRRGDGRRGRGELAGKDFAPTIKTEGKQAFTVPTIADKGTLKACDGGTGKEVEVTRGRFRVREADSAKASDGKKDGDKKKRRRGLFR